MIVIDASALVEAVTRSDAGLQVIDRISRARKAFAPDHVDVETVSAVHRLARADAIDGTTAQLALRSLGRLALDRLPTALLTARVWALRHNVRIADGFYVALAESLEVPLLTCDGRLTRAPGPSCEFELVER